MTLPTDAMVEAGARALYERQPVYGATFDIETSDRVSVAERFPWEALIHPVQDRYRDTARAVLAAALPLALADAAEAAKALEEFVQNRFEVPPEHDSEPIPFHKGWELCAREIYPRARAVRARLIASPPRASGG